MKINTKLILVLAFVSPAVYAQSYYCPINIALTNQTSGSLSKVKIENNINGNSSTISADSLAPSSNLNLDFQSVNTANGTFLLSINGQTLCSGSYNMEFIPDMKNPCKLNMNYASYSVTNNRPQAAKLGIRCVQTGILNSLTQTSLTVGVEKN